MFALPEPNHPKESSSSIGVFGLMTKAVANSGLSIFKELGMYALTIVCGLSIHLFIVLPLILFLIVKKLLLELEL